MDLQSMLAGDWFERLATATSATPATPAATPTADVASVAPVAVANPPVTDPSSAAQMGHVPPQNDYEDGIFSASWHRQFNERVQCCVAHGIPQNHAESLAFHMMPYLGERERRLCLECRHLYGSPNARRCRQWRQIGQTGGPAIPQDLVTTLQRCPGFTSCFEIYHDKETSPHEDRSGSTA